MDEIKNNPIVHFEIHATDMDKSQAFYEQLFGWRFQNMGSSDYGDYRVIMTGDNQGPGPAKNGINGGMAPRRGPAPASDAPVSGFVNIIAVADCDATLKKAIELGGSEALAPMEVPKVGRLAYAKDPDGNIFGILKPDLSGMQQ